MNEKIEKTPQKSNTTKKEKKPTPKGHDLMLAIAFWIFGLMFFYFPNYSGITNPWAWIFYVIAYFWYLVSMIGAVLGLTNLTKNEFVKNAGFGFVFGIIAFLLHKWSEGINIANWASILLKILALPVAMIAVAGFATGIPYLWDPEISSGETKDSSNSRLSKPEEKPAKSLFEQTVSIVVALLSLLTALAPLLKEWLVK